MCVAAPFAAPRLAADAGDVGFAPTAAAEEEEEEEEGEAAAAAEAPGGDARASCDITVDAGAAGSLER